MAELLGAPRKLGRDRDRSQLFHEPHRGALPALRRASRACLRGWAQADRVALLHEWRLARVPTRRDRAGFEQARQAVAGAEQSPAVIASVAKQSPAGDS